MYARVIGAFPLWLAAVCAIALMVSGCDSSEQSVADQTETPPHPATVAPQVWDMQLLDATSGWALTSLGLEWTNSQGKDWEDITPAETSADAIRGVSFGDTKEGWLVTSGPPDSTGATQLLLFHTQDSGQTWQSGPLGSPDQSYTESSGGLASIDFVDSSKGWVLVQLVSITGANRADLLSTTDAGVTWSKSAVPAFGTVRFANDTTGWIAGGPGGGSLLATQDGGVTWKPSSLPVPPQFVGSYPVYSFPASANAKGPVVAVTYTGGNSGIALFVTGDGGQSWQTIGEVSFAAPVEIGTAGSSDVFGGETWVAIAPQGDKVYSKLDDSVEARILSPNGLTAVVKIDFATPMVGWALAQSGTCLNKTDCSARTDLRSTVDGGQTWETLNP